MTDVVLFQERWRRRPFWMLVGCILVNRTRWEDAEPVHRELRRRWPSPWRLSQAAPRQVEAVVRRLGFGKTRAVKLVRFAASWYGWRTSRNPVNRGVVEAMPGCGQYAADSWSIFIEGRWPAGVTDKKLRAYLARGQRERKRC